MKLKSHKELVSSYARAFNHLNSNYICDNLADDFQYTSQWVFSEIENKKDYLEYFEQKLKRFINSDIKVIARLGLYRNNYCLVIYQIDLSKRKQTKIVTLLIETQKGEIKRANMCMIPSISQINLLEEIPS